MDGPYLMEGSVSWIGAMMMSRSETRRKNTQTSDLEMSFMDDKDTLRLGGI